MTTPATDMNETNRLATLEKPALIIGVIAIIVAIAGFFIGGDHGAQFFRSYLYAFIVVMAIPVGSLALLAIHNLSGGVWGLVARRYYEAGARTMWFAALAFIPLIFGTHQLYEWTHQEVVAQDAILQWKAPYLNGGFWSIRGIAIVVIWTLLAMMVTRLGSNYERTGDPHTALRARRLSAATLLILAITLTFASVDWVMSTEPHWFSTMYGISFMVGAFLIGHAFAIIGATRNATATAVRRIAGPVPYRDLGNLMLAFVLLWAYTGFSQLLLIWYGNLREEIPWYIKRSQGGWLILGGLLLVMHFFVPFFALLNRPLKENPVTLGRIAMYLILMRVLDVFWYIAPAFHPTDFHLSWMDVAALLGLGGIWFFLYIRNLRDRSLVPIHATTHGEALQHG